MEEPVFVKQLTCTTGVEEEVIFITDNDWTKKVVDIEIPKLPDGMSLEFYAELTEPEYTKHMIHRVSFRINAEEPDSDEKLPEPVVFDEVVVKWNDGTETVADIGTVHIMSITPENGLEHYGNSGWSDEDGRGSYSEEFFAKEDLTITEVIIPYYEDKAYSFISDVTFDEWPIEDISEENPVHIDQGSMYFMNYNLNDNENSQYKTICKVAHIKHNGQHALRHTFATRCIEAGVPALVLKNWLGHTDIHVTLDTYADVFDRMNLGAISKLDRLMDEVMAECP